MVKLLQILDSFTVAVNKSETDKQAGSDVVKLSIRSGIAAALRCSVLLTKFLDALAPG